MGKKTIERKNKDKLKKEATLISVARLMIAEPLLSLDTKAFIKKVVELLGLPRAQARKAVEEVLKREALLSDINYKKELAKKIKELAFVKEVSLQSNNISAYLGAVKLESAILGLEKLNIFRKEEEEEDVNLDFKKELILQEYFKIKDKE